MHYQTLIAVDPSLTCSGWALFSVEQQTLMAVGKIRSLPASVPLAWRLEDLQRKITEALEKLGIDGDDVMVCEAPTTMRDPRAAIRVEQVRSLFEVVARARNVCVPGRLNPRTVHREIMGLRGRQLPRDRIKEAAIGIVHALYGVALESLGFSSDQANLKKNQDIVDALLLGNLALSRMHAAKGADIALETYFEKRTPLRAGRAMMR